MEQKLKKVKLNSLTIILKKNSKTRPQILQHLLLTLKNNLDVHNGDTLCQCIAINEYRLFYYYNK